MKPLRIQGCPICRTYHVERVGQEEPFDRQVVRIAFE